MREAVKYGAFRPPGRHQRLGVLTDDDAVLDLTELATTHELPHPDLLLEPTLDPLLAAGAPVWREVHEWLTALLADPEPVRPHQRPLHTVTPALAFTVADYVDFFACERHAVNAARIFGDEEPDPLPPAWRYQPIGYHGRAGTVVVSGTEIRRPRGPRGPGDVGPCQLLDFEAELGYVLGGPPSTLGDPVGLAEAAERVFGVVLLNDWSARDLQFWESRPLGPLLGKAFATSVSAWVTPLAEVPRAAPPPRRPTPPEHLLGAVDQGLALTMTVAVNGEVISRPPAADLYWTPAQLVTHLTCGGAVVRPGDLLGSGTVSGPERDQWGCLFELSWHGREPLRLADGSELTYLRDGDEVTITAEGAGVRLGEVRGRIAAAGAQPR